MLPKFHCLDASKGAEEYECEHKDFCKDGHLIDGITYIPQWESKYGLYNWIKSMDLYCISDFRMGLFGSIYFVGFVVGALTVVRLGDVYGRKWVLVSLMIFQAALFAVLLFFQVQWVTYVTMFFFGIQSTARYGIAYSYGLEFCPEKYKQLLSTIYFIFSALCLIIVAFFFPFISKKWEYYALIGVAYNVLSLIGLPFLPESPKFLHGKNRFSMARQSLNVIGRFNGAQIDGDIVF